MKKIAAPSAVIAIILAALIFHSVRQAKAQAPREFPSGFIVVDSTGKQLGPVIGVQYGGSGNLTTVALPLHGKWWPVSVQRTSFFAIENILYFASSDCSGQPFQYAADGPWPNDTVFGPGPKLFVESGPHQSITSESYLGDDGTCYPSTDSLSDAVPVASALDLSIFKPPFRVVPAGP